MDPCSPPVSGAEFAPPFTPSSVQTTVKLPPFASFIHSIESPSGSPIPDGKVPRRIQTIVPPPEPLTLTLSQNVVEIDHLDPPKGFELNWSEYLAEDFPDIPVPVPPSTWKVSSVAKRSVVNQVPKEPEMIIRYKPADPVSKLFHQSLSISPIVGMGYSHLDGPIDFEPGGVIFAHDPSRLMVCLRARQLLDLYLKILSLQEAENRAHFIHYIREKVITERLVLPALMARGVVLRPPLVREVSRICEVLPQLSPALVHYLAEGVGLMEVEGVQHRLHLLTPLYLPFHTLGGLHLVIVPTENGPSCRISLNIPSQQERRRGCGTLLFQYAVQVAQKEQCREILIEATPQNLPFCLEMGFRPIHPNLTLEIWHSWNRLQQTQAADQVCRHWCTTLILPLQEIGIAQEQKLKNVLDPRYMNR